MDAERLDALTQAVWTSDTRRRVLRHLAMASLAGMLAAHFAARDGAAAEHPVRRVQNRQENSRQRSRRQKERHRGRRRRDNGKRRDDDHLLRDCPDLRTCCLVFGDTTVDELGPMPGAPIGQCWTNIFTKCRPCDGRSDSVYQEICRQAYPNDCKSASTCFPCQMGGF